MAMTSWQFSGDYLEACRCDFLRPCLPSTLAAPPTRSDCHFAMVFHISQGRYHELTLANLNCAVVGYTPTVMSQGHWSVGCILDERGGVGQQHAISAIASGQRGGFNPTSIRLALRRATQCDLYAVGRDWDEAGGQHSDHFA